MLCKDNEFDQVRFDFLFFSFFIISKHEIIYLRRYYYENMTIVRCKLVGKIGEFIRSSIRVRNLWIRIDFDETWIAVFGLRKDNR